MNGQTLFPPSNDYRSLPILHSQTTDAPHFREKGYEWFYSHLPVLSFVNGRATAKSISVCLNNMSFKSDGSIKRVSPALLRWLAACYDLTKHTGGVDLCRVYSSHLPQARYKLVLPRHHPKVLAFFLKGTNMYECQSLYHRSSFQTPPIVRNSSTFLGKPVCEICYKKMFVTAPTGWYSLADIQTITTKKFYADVIKPLETQPLYFMLIGGIVEQQRSLSASQLLRFGQTIITHFPLHVFKMCLGRNFALKYARAIKCPQDAYHIRNMRLSTTPKTFLEIAIEEKNILRHGWAVDFDDVKGRIRTAAGRVVNLSSSKGHLPSLDLYLLYVIVCEKQVVVLTRGCMSFLQRVYYNEPPITIHIQLMAKDTQKHIRDTVPERLYAEVSPKSELCISKCETMTFDALYYAMKNTMCSTLKLRGSYHQSIKARAKSDRYTRCFADIVDLLHYVNGIQVGDYVNPSPTARGCKIFFETIGVHHFATDEAVSDHISAERAVFGLAAWPPEYAKEYKYAQLPKWNLVPHPSASVSTRAIPENAIENRAEKLVRLAQRKRLSRGSVRSQICGNRNSSKSQPPKRKRTATEETPHRSKKAARHSV